MGWPTRGTQCLKSKQSACSPAAVTHRNERRNPCHCPHSHQQRNEGQGNPESYAGLLENEIIDMDTKSVSEIMRRGGTMLFTARCKEFMTPEGQAKGAQILREHGIEGLIVIGGDGSFMVLRSLRLSALIRSVFQEQSILILPAQTIQSALIPRSIPP